MFHAAKIRVLLILDNRYLCLFHLNNPIPQGRFQKTDSLQPPANGNHGGKRAIFG